MLAAFVAFAPGQADRIGDLRASMGTQAEILADLHDHHGRLHLRPVAVPNHRPVPHVALWTGIPPGQIVSAQLEQPTRGLYVDPASERVLRNFTLDPRDPKSLTADVPAGFQEVAANDSWRLYAALLKGEKVDRAPAVEVGLRGLSTSLTPAGRPRYAHR